MLMVIHRYEIVKGKPQYTLFDTLTKSTIKCDKNFIVKTINKGFKVENAEFLDNVLKVRMMNGGAKYTLISIMNGKEYKLVDSDGKMHAMENKEIFEQAKSNNLSNCRINERGSLSSTLVSRISTNKVLEEQIKEEYNKYISKSKLLGKDTSFDYYIENNEVILTNYSGTTKDVVLPGFITAIRSCAFLLTKINSVKLNNGLKAIGSNAFNSCALSEVTIPETTEQVLRGVFDGNIDMLDSEKRYIDNGKIKMLGGNTIMM